ncbi:MAG TPA: cytochrome c-type biogenesis protein [Hypericibacter adhaerens]|jgi:cytochrome c-type biogenesis protein CcmH|uniref:Cytochrome c-type biogenesis protein n=2 Tax=Hypericibacter adhaerens TaxID=2602016 RepID=A0A5J6N7C1_9PROT|nr:cytochrome c-type biogenesis protein [Hypericibacter adhaerens]QEX24945.1 cytochrome c-type biogenesis protein CcmH [Hypericibacter adhaerens]HWA42930.1 cytochrome c-type biogenesis protein [Hypericibacter adhaerens]
MKRRFLSLAFLAALLSAVSALAFAVEPNEMLSDPGLEARARVISRDIRCLVCQNQSIDDSQAELAHDLRVLIRERLLAGDSDQQVRDYLVARYGDFVLLAPPLKPKTYLLWFGPAAIFLVALILIALYFRRRRQDAAPAPLNAEEAARLETLLAEDDDTTAPRREGPR